MPDLICPVSELKVLTCDDIKKSTEGLSSTVSEGAIFMISYDLTVSSKDIRISPYCRVWVQLAGKVRAILLDSKQPELARTVAPQMFSFMNIPDLMEACRIKVCPMIPRDIETYHCCLSPHGVIVMADGVPFFYRNYGDDSCFVGFMQPNLSNHQTLARLKGLQDCADALLSEQQQYLSDDHKDFRVKVTRQ